MSHTKKPPSTTSKPSDVLFFGDSITWGMGHKFTGRYDVSWPRLIEGRLRSRGYNVLESALCSRTSGVDDFGDIEWLVGGEPHCFNGFDHFVPEFLSCSPRALVLLLGTNDLKAHIRSQTRLRTKIDALAIARACAKIGLLAKKAHEGTARMRAHPLTVVLVPPPVVRLNQLSRDLGYDDVSVKLSMDFPAAYKKVCAEHGFEYCFVPGVDMAHSVDGVHVTPEANQLIAEAVWNKLDGILEQITPLPYFGYDVTKGDLPAPPPRPENDGSGGGRLPLPPKRSHHAKLPLNRFLSSSIISASSSSSNEKIALQLPSFTVARKRKLAVTTLTSGSSSETDDDDPVEMTRAKQIALLGLRCVQCDVCKKWRYSRVAENKTRWTCRNKFWSTSLKEWKTGCSWTGEQKRNAPRKGLGVCEAMAVVVEKMLPPKINERKARPLLQLQPPAPVKVEAKSRRSRAAAENLVVIDSDASMVCKPEATPKSAKKARVEAGAASSKSPSSERKTTTSKAAAGTPVIALPPIPAVRFTQQTPMTVNPQMYSALTHFLGHLISRVPHAFLTSFTTLSESLTGAYKSQQVRYQAYRDMRAMFMNFPDVVYELDCLVTAHPLIIPVQLPASPMSAPVTYWNPSMLGMPMNMAPRGPCFFPMAYAPPPLAPSNGRFF